MRGRDFFILLCVAIFVMMASAALAGVIDTYSEDFDDRQDDTTIHGVDTWSVDQGTTSNAITQNSTTYTGTGKALELVGAETSVNVSNTKSFLQVSPTWIEFIIKPGIGAQTRSVPQGKIAAITFDHTGKIYASDGSSWVDTGETFTSDEWYRVTLKLDFSTHLYDIYISPVATPEVIFSPDKENLQFIDTSISSLSQLGLGGTYHTTRTDDDSYVDNLIVHFIDRLQITTASQTMTEGKPSGLITVQLQNALSETQTAWEDFTLELRTTSNSGEFSLAKDEWKPIIQLLIPDGSQSASFYYKDAEGGKPIITVSEYPDRGWQDAIQEQKVVSEVANFEISVVTPQIAGKYFNLVIVAKEEDGSINETYEGEIELTVKYVTPETGTKILTPQIASGFKSGTLELSVMYPDCGVIQIVVNDKDDISKAGTSGQIRFIPADFVIACGSPQITGSAFPLTITAYNAREGEPKEITPNYKGPTVLEVIPVSPVDTSGGAISPALLEIGDFTDGAANVNAIYDRWGKIKIKAYDKDYPSRTGTSEVVDFRPAAILVEVIAPSGTRDFFYIGEDIEIVISVIDGKANPIPNYLGLIAIDSTVGLSMPGEYQFVAADKGLHAFLSSANTSGTYTVTTEDKQSGLTAQSPDIKVKSATLVVIDTEAPIGTTEVTVQLVDENNNVITSENDLTITVELEEENSNSSATSPALHQSVTFKDGIANILLSDSEAENVTISPKSAYKFKVKKGTVKFGRVAKTGIGVLMWREVKD